MKKTGKKIAKRGRVKPVKSDLTVTALQKAKRSAGDFMSRYDLLLRDKVKGGCGEANRYARERHKELFGELPTNISINIVKARVCYGLMEKGYKEHGVEDRLPKGFKQNYRAAMKNNLGGFTPDVRELIQLDSLEGENGKGGGSKMEKKKAKVKKKAARKIAAGKLSIFAVLCNLYWVNNKTKYSDEKILALAKKKVGKVPSSYTMGNVRRVRNLLNTGKVARYGKPKKQIQSFN